MDRMAGLQDLQDKLCWAKLGVKYGQDCRITRFTGFFSCSKDLIYEQFEWITDD